MRYPIIIIVLGMHHSLADVFNRTSCRLAREVFTYAAITARKIFVQKYPPPSIVWFSDRPAGCSEQARFESAKIFEQRNPLIVGPKFQKLRLCSSCDIPNYGLLDGKGSPHGIVGTYAEFGLSLNVAIITVYCVYWITHAL